MMKIRRKTPRIINALFAFSMAALFLFAAKATVAEEDGKATLFDLLRTAGGEFNRASSTEAKGNNDYITIEPGKSAVIFEVAGSGVINRLWMTTLCADPSWPRMLVIEMYWDGETGPSVRVPLGDFFGAAMGRRYEFQSDMLAILPRRGLGLNSYWPMPFAKGAKIIIRNDSTLPVQAFYYQVDYEKLAKPPTPLRFHASWRQAKQKSYIEGMERFEMLKLEGPGCFAGYSAGIHNTEGGWFGEGDEIIRVDGRTAQGTGLEDALGSAWRPKTTYAGPHFGFMFDDKVKDDWKGAHNLYKLYTKPPICFKKSFSLAIERRAIDAWSAVVYRYQPNSGGIKEKLSAPKQREPLRSEEGAEALEETRRLFAEIYKLAGWPDKFIAFNSVGDLISRTDTLFSKEDYSAALRLLRAAAREPQKE